MCTIRSFAVFGSLTPGDSARRAMSTICTIPYPMSCCIVRPSPIANPDLIFWMHSASSGGVGQTHAMGALGKVNAPTVTVTWIVEPSGTARRIVSVSICCTHPAVHASTANASSGHDPSCSVGVGSPTGAIAGFSFAATCSARSIRCTVSFMIPAATDPIRSRSVRWSTERTTMINDAMPSTTATITEMFGVSAEPWLNVRVSRRIRRQ